MHKVHKAATTAHNLTLHRFFWQESIGALYWVHLFKALNSVVAHLVGQSGEAVQELRKTVDAKQRALFDSDFVEAVFDNFGDVALRRAAQTLIGNLTGLVVQRAHMDPDEWDLKCQTAFARHELAMQHNAADVAVLPDRHKVWLWSKEDVADWLCYHGFAEYCKVFKDHEVCQSMPFAWTPPPPGTVQCSAVGIGIGIVHDRRAYSCRDCCLLDGHNPVDLRAACDCPQLDGGLGYLGGYQPTRIWVVATVGRGRFAALSCFAL